MRNKLDEKLPGRWIGRRGPIEWPARSPDLTPLDFFFWGFIKDKVYKTKFDLADVEHLKEEITRRIEELKANPELLRKVTGSVSGRVQQCLDAGGGHFEY